LRLPSKQEIIEALKNPDTFEACQTILCLIKHPKWSSAKVLHRCPLCGHYSTDTNVHRRCPENPTEWPVPMYVAEELKVVKKHKHQWRKVGSSYSKKSGLTKTKKRCIVPGCGAEKEV